MKCPKCESSSCRKNGSRSGKQNYLCKNCGRQFLLPSSSNRQNAARHDHDGYTQNSVAQATELPLSPQTDKASYDEIKEVSLSVPGISILLLDAENLKLNIKIETFLASICKSDLQVKIAFANWRNSNMGKQDSELYERGYQLVHVPGGKDSADGQMIAFGASILRQYPTVKEVFVCSCDQILTHLCNQLQNQGITVYWVRRQAQSLKVENRTNGELSYYSLAMGTSIPSFESFAQKIEELIKTEQESITERLSKLTAVATLFQERCNLTLMENNSNELGEIVSMPEVESTQIIPKKQVKSDDATIITAVNNINSREELEKALIEIIQAIQVKYPQTQLSVASLGTELRKISGQTPNSIIKKLKLGSSFTKFLDSCSIFKLKKTDKEYEVAIAQQ